MPTADLGDVGLYYERRGKGPPVLGIMGFALDQRFWAAQIPAVTKTHSFVTFDNRAIGRSSGPAASTIDEMAEDVFRLLDHLSIERTVVLGVSMGGAIAQRLAIDHPDRVSALILGVTWARPIEFMRRQNDLAELLVEVGGAQALIDASLVRMFTPRFFEAGREAIDRMVAAFMSDADQMPDASVLLAQLEAIGKHDTLDQLSDIDCPTLVAGGKMDMMVPYFASEEIAGAIAGAQLATFETGHGCMIEEMEAFNRRVEEFLAQL
jgi:pimeloyl-ACP methyl ester carboxylesterase